MTSGFSPSFPNVPRSFDALKEKAYATSHAPDRNWKTTFDVKLLRLVTSVLMGLSDTLAQHSHQLKAVARNK
jgi:hypothetical protein